MNLASYTSSNFRDPDRNRLKGLRVLESTRVVVFSSHHRKCHTNMLMYCSIQYELIALQKTGAAANSTGDQHRDRDLPFPGPVIAGEIT